MATMRLSITAVPRPGGVLFRFAPASGGEGALEIPLSSDDAVRIAHQLVASALADYADPGVRAAGTLAVTASRLVLTAAENPVRFEQAGRPGEVESLLEQLARTLEDLQLAATGKIEAMERPH